MYTRDSKLFPVIIFDLRVRVYSGALLGHRVMDKRLGCSGQQWVSSFPQGPPQHLGLCRGSSLETVGSKFASFTTGWHQELSLVQWQDLISWEHLRPQEKVH